MKFQQKAIVTILISISVIGIIGIQIGNPKFLTNAIILESIFIVLTILSFKKLQYTLIPNMVIAIIVIIGNTASPKHIEIMSLFEPLENSIVLIVGGYVLQSLLLVSSLMVFKKKERLKIKFN